MITKASIRRFLWRHFPSLHEMIYDHFTEQEYQEMIDYILNKEKTNNSNNLIKHEQQCRRF